jgi:biotin carboxyl carrier protein
VQARRPEDYKLTTSQEADNSRMGEATGGVFLDAEAFGDLKNSRDTAAFAAAWLDTISRIISDMRQAVVLLGASGRGGFEPAGVWPKGAASSAALKSASESAIKSGRLILQNSETGRGADAINTIAIAYPFTINGRISGAAAIEIEQGDDAATRLAMDQLEWGCGWLETIVRRRRVTNTDRLVTVVELLATSLHHDRFQAAATAVATELAGTMACERVSIGFLRGRHAQVRALSHSAAFGKKANLIRAIEAAMDEAMDQQALVTYPPLPGGVEQVTRAHAAMAREQGAGPICTVPLAEGGKLIGALCLERPLETPFDADTVQLCEHIAGLLGPVLDVKRRDDRWLVRKAYDSFVGVLRKLLGPRHIAWKLSALILIAVVTFFVFAKGDYRVTADATLEGTVQRAIAAPIAGYLADATVRAGDIVRKGQVMALLDQRDLRLERLKWLSQRSKQKREYSEALAKHERAQARILKTQIAQAEAQIALLDEQLQRLRIVAPFDGFVVNGDLSQSLGAPVERGDVLFEIAPLHGYRVMLSVDEREINVMKLG